MAALLVSALHAGHREAGDLTTYSTQVVPLVIVGEGWSQRVVLQNVDAKESAVGTLSFYTKDGAPWTVNLGDKGRSNTFLINLLPGQSAIYETVVEQGAQQLGWALISLGSSGSGDLFGQVIFRKQTVGSPDFMCSHILAAHGFDRVSLFFDNTGGKYTGTGIVLSSLCNLSSCSPEPLQVTVKDLNGGTIAKRIITQKRGALYWMSLGADFPETANRTGVFVVELSSSSAAYISGFSLQFAPNGAFTAITPYEE